MTIPGWWVKTHLTRGRFAPRTPRGYFQPKEEWTLCPAPFFGSINIPG